LRRRTTQVWRRGKATLFCTSFGTSFYFFRI
jgi:hypothetical protein